jgi:hypothetical protein
MRAKPGPGLANLALVSAYFVPVWGQDALRALTSPYNGFEDRAHAAVAVLVRDLFDFGLEGLLRTSSALAGVKLVIAAGFLAYLIEFAYALAARQMPSRETADQVLVAALAVVTIWLGSAFSLGEADVVRLEATQFLLLVGAALVLTIERCEVPARGPRIKQPAVLPPTPVSPAALAYLPQAPRSDLPAARPT